MERTRNRIRRRLAVGVTACAVVGSALASAPLTAAQAGPPRATGATAAAQHSRAATGSGIVRAWNAWAGEAAKAACLAPVDNPLTESRAYALMHIAVHDALNSIRRRYAPYVYDGRAPRGASVPAAVAAASRGVLVPTLLAIPAPFPPACGQAGAAYVEARYAEAVAAIPDGPAKVAGLAVGSDAADAVLGARAADGSDTPLVDPTFRQGAEPGQWRFTPGTPFAFAPGWGDVDPFVLEEAGQFMPPPPPALTSRTYTRDLLEVKRLGGDGITTPSERTAEQTEVALFWVESSPLAWNRIARDVAASRHFGEWASARLFGLLNMAMADGYVASFRTKYTYLFWRPVTAIREAAGDGNPFTSPDPTWTPLVTTPPIPDYESAHAVEGAAAVAVMRGVLGTDHVRFTACSLTLPAGQRCSDPQPVLRSYARLSQASAENAESRVLVGFHFRTAAQRGIQLGTAIGSVAVRSEMQRVPANR